jgi:hypothetical protein
MAVETTTAPPPQFDPSVLALLHDFERSRAAGCGLLSLQGGGAYGTDAFAKLAAIVVQHQHCIDVLSELLGSPPALKRLLRPPKSPPTRRNARGQRRPTTYRSKGKGAGTQRPAKPAGAS